ncbi:MAG TPA: tetratricopeptide repeat protein, partial [Polyangiaceae bacterium]|nr:tetratricopeptide repeat protein [Polyangiaceae bacterium]
MDTIRTALGQLQQDSDNAEAWQALEAGVEKLAGKHLAQIHELFTAAKAVHAARHEWWACARLAALELAATPSSPALTELWREYGNAQLQHLYDDNEAATAFGMVLQANRKDPGARSALSDIEERKEHWQQRAAQYLSEAENAPDDAYKSAMLMRGAEMQIRCGGDHVDVDLVEARLTEACRLDPDNLSASEMIEYLVRRTEGWAALASVLEDVVARSKSKETRRVAGLKLARICLYRIVDRARAASAYQQLLETEPTNDEASSFLTEHHSQQGAWQELVRVYERRLASESEDGPERLGDMLQIALLYSRKLNQPAAADPWFERVRKIDPANAAMLEFFREYLLKIGDGTRLTAVLQKAERTLPNGPEKDQVVADLAALQTKEQGAQHTVEHYKAQLRQDPSNVEVRTKLKALYKEAGSYNALVELLRQQFERTPAEDQSQRLSVLKEVAAIYRQHLPGDPALASVLTQIAALDPDDPAVHRDLCAVYERLARWRELLGSQQKLVEVTPDAQEKATLLRAMARRWMEQFSNVQNATAAYEALLALEPRDQEAREQLTELYTKRRSWQQLYDLLASQPLEELPVPERVSLLRQMASLCAERLSKPQEAMQLYREIVALDAAQSEVVEALEKQAERAKDWPALVEALEKRIDATPGAEAQIALLQKLGGVYADQLADQGKALEVWRRVVDLQPGHSRALRYLREAYLASQDFDALEQLYASQNDFDGLAEVLGHAAEKTDDVKIKIDLSYRAARVYSESLGQPTRAFRSYERILAADPQDTRAANELIPIYEQDDKWARLPALYDILVSASNDAYEKFEYLTKMAQISSANLGDRLGSLTYARRAFEVLPDDTQGLALLEKAAAAAGRWDILAEALTQRLSQLQAEQASSDSAEARRRQGKKKKKKGKQGSGEYEAVATPVDGATHEIALRLAQVCDAHLQQADRAIELLKSVVQRNPSDIEAASKLEVLLRREGKRDDLRWLLEQKVDQAGDDEKVRLLSEWAQLEEEVFKEGQQAALLYRRLLEINPGQIAALRSLSRLLLVSGAFDDLAAVLERALDSLGGLELSEIEVQLAQLYLDQLNKPSKALHHAMEALAHGSHDSRAIALLERLVKVEATRERAAQVLAKEYAEVGDARHEVEALQAMLSAAKDPDERFSLMTRLAEIQEHKLDSVNASFDTLLRAVREFPERVELWDRAQDLAARAERAAELAEALRETLTRVQGTEFEFDICERAAQLHLEKLGDPAGAVPYLERILKRDPGNNSAFAQLKHVLTAEERWGELGELYEVVIAHEELPVVQVELLLEVALLCEEITEDLPAAIRYYERIHTMDPANEVASNALDRLYVRLGKNEQLAGLLERRISEVGDSEQNALMTRLAGLLIEKLHRPADAIGHVEAVLDRDAGDAGARDLAERLMQLGSLKQQAATLLERVYESRDEPRELARVLDVQLGLLKEQGAGKVNADADLTDRYKEMLRRVAALRDDRLHEDAAAFAALAQLVPLEPLDFAARGRLEEIAGRLQNFSQLVEVLTQAEHAVEPPDAKAEILLKAAELCEGRLQDLDRAETLYARVLSLREHAPDAALSAARSLDRIYTQLGKDAKLAQALRSQIDLEFSDDAKGQLQARLANLFETRLAKIEQAIAVWHERLETNPGDAQALGSLDRLYETTGRWAELVPILRQRHEQSTDAGEQHTLLVRLAQVLSDKIGDLEGAIAAWATILEQEGNSDPARNALEHLYQAAQRWQDLAESYLAHVEVAPSDQARLELWRKLGDVRAGKLAAAEAALDAYREGLALDSRYAPIRAALQQLLQTEDAGIRREVAIVLRGLYEAEHDHAHLLSTLEVQVAASEDAIDKVEVLQLAVKVAEVELRDVRRAFTLARQAITEGAGHVDLTGWLADLDRLSAAAGERTAQVALLREIVDRIFDGDLKYEVLLKIARLAQDELGQAELARDYFEQATQQDPSRAEPLLALDGIYQKAGQWSEVLRVLERRIELATTDEERQQLLFQKARLLGTQLGQAADATEAYEAIISERMDPQALQALEGLYRAQERYSDLVSLIEREVDVDPGRAAHHRIRMAEILAGKLGDMARALDEVEAALEVSPHFAEGTAFLAKVMTQSDLEAEHRGRAAALLEPIYLAAANYDRVLEVLSVRLETVNDPLEKRRLLLQLAKLYEEQKENFGAALETIAVLFQDDARDESVIMELERLAKVADAKVRLAEIYAKELTDATISDGVTAGLARRTGELLAEQGQEERALGFLERALDFEPDNAELFALVDKILERLGRHRGRVDLYTKILDQKYDPAERLRLQHAIAQMERVQLRDPSRAIDAYVQVLD